jgi:hypothetical protein
MDVNFNASLTYGTLMQLDEHYIPIMVGLGLTNPQSMLDVNTRKWIIFIQKLNNCIKKTIFIYIYIYAY